jgi:hypothetical protein
MLDDAGWISCEETIEGPAEGWGKGHGYCFAVPLRGPEPGSPATASPLPAMGRFSHEAVAVDPTTGFVYMTEDDRDQLCGFYRFRPNDPRRLGAGGVLEMAKVRGFDGYDTRQGQALRTRLPVEWVVIEDPDPNLEGCAKSCSAQGRAKGAALFNRLEGASFANGCVWFTSTSGGSTKSGVLDEPSTKSCVVEEKLKYLRGYGQVWQFVPSEEGGTLILLYESTGAPALDSPDNLTITPRGGILLCEDDASEAEGDRHPSAPEIANVNRLIGLDPDGMTFEFAANIDGDANYTSEFAGACFSPDGDVLFVNHFGHRSKVDPPGRTYAITGPWKRGPL